MVYSLSYDSSVRLYVTGARVHAGFRATTLSLEWERRVPDAKRYIGVNSSINTASGGVPHLLSRWTLVGIVRGPTGWSCAAFPQRAETPGVTRLLDPPEFVALRLDNNAVHRPSAVKPWCGRARPPYSGGRLRLSGRRMPNL